MRRLRRLPGVARAHMSGGPVRRTNPRAPAAHCAMLAQQYAAAARQDRAFVASHRSIPSTPDRYGASVMALGVSNTDSNSPERAVAVAGEPPGAEAIGRRPNSGGLRGSPR